MFEKLFDAFRSPLESRGGTPGVEGKHSAPSHSTIEDGPNSHLADYIDYYQKLQEPGYAVLVTGEWGTGKTHMMKELLPWEGENKQSYYVSLFGLKTADEVDAAIYAEMYPLRSSVQDGIKDAGEATRGVSLHGYSLGGVLSGAANAVAAYMRKEIDLSKPIIFDDLERSSIATAEEKLGVINYYVEHRRCRVIVIAHDEKLVDAIMDAKEKIFGQTIRIEPDLKSAFAKFQGELSDKSIAGLIAGKEDVILDVFSKSPLKSLRILRHVMLDLERFLGALEPRHLDNEHAIRELVPLFVALATAIRANQLDPADLRERHGAALRRELRKIASAQNSESLDPSKFEKLQKLYGGIDLESQALNDDALVDMLVRGRYQQDVIRTSLDSSLYFAKTEELPPWRKVIGFDKLPDDVVEQGAKALEQQFSERAVSEPGEMLHMIALRMMMAKHGILQCSVEDVVDESKAYIDDLLSDGRLPGAISDPEYDMGMSASHGYSYWVEESYQNQFASVLVHLSAQQKVALEATYPAAGRQLLAVLLKDAQEFAGAISYLAGGTNKYANLPVMNAIPVKDFVDSWLNAADQPEGWYWTRAALERRYEGIALLPGRGPLASEADWVRAVIAEMRNRSEAETGFKKFRMERAIPRLTLPSEAD